MSTRVGQKDKCVRRGGKKASYGRSKSNTGGLCSVGLQRNRPAWPEALLHPAGKGVVNAGCTQETQDGVDVVIETALWGAHENTELGASGEEVWGQRGSAVTIQVRQDCPEMIPLWVAAWVASMLKARISFSFF